MEIIKASEEDIETITAIRLEFLAEDAEVTPEMGKHLGQRNREYFQEHLNRDCVVFFAKEEAEIAGVAILVISEKPANLRCPSGKTGLVLNVYTRSLYRRRGIATALMQRIIEEGRTRGLSLIELTASPAGEPVYRQLGFQNTLKSYTPMQFRLDDGFYSV